MALVCFIVQEQYVFLHHTVCEALAPVGQSYTAAEFLQHYMDVTDKSWIDKEFEV